MKLRSSIISMLQFLNNLKVNQEVLIEEVRTDSSALEQLTSLGFTPGTPVSIISKLPFGGPIACKLRGTKFAIRHADACNILVSQRS